MRLKTGLGPLSASAGLCASSTDCVRLPPLLYKLRGGSGINKCRDIPEHLIHLTLRTYLDLRKRGRDSYFTEGDGTTVCLLFTGEAQT